MKALTRFLTAPHRTIQIAIWLMLAAVMATAVPMASGGGSLVSVVSAPSISETSSAYPTSTITLADDDKNGLKKAGAVSNAVTSSVEDPIDLLPAYRWRSAMSLPEDVGSKDGAFGKNLTTAASEGAFAISGAIWFLLLELMNFAMSMDVVSSFSHAINDFFATTWTGLSKVGVPALIGIFVACMAAVAAAKGKLNDSLRMGVSALLVLGLLQTLGVAASNDKASNFEGSGASYSDSIPKLTPAWLAMTGNLYVNELALGMSSLFGGTAGITQDVVSGAADGAGEAAGTASCTYYNQRLYSAYGEAMGDQAATAAAMSMVSFMWQRSMYDPYAQAAFGSTQLGAPAACHLLERNAGITPQTQQNIAGPGVAGSPYAGMGVGPFTTVGDKKKNQAQEMAWGVCATKSTWRLEAWGATKHFEDDKVADVCGKWWEDDEGTGMTKQDGGALGWSQKSHLHDDTVGKDPSNVEMAQIKSYVEAYWGHNSGQRFMASSTTIVTSVLYAYAFGFPAIGVLLSQFVLLFMLLLLPWTLVLLAMPGKGGARNGVGVKLTRLTAMAFGGKLIFVMVMGLTLTLMSALFSFTLAGNSVVHNPVAADSVVLAASSGMSSNMVTFWSVLVPIVAIVAMKFLMKAAGVGNLMGINGAMGFATAAMKQGKDGKWASSKVGGGGSGAGGKFSGLSGMVKSKKDKLTTAGKDSIKSRKERSAGSKEARRAARAIKKKGGTWLSQDLADRVATGGMSAYEARAEQKARNKGGEDALPKKLAERVARGELSHKAARKIQKAQAQRALLAAAAEPASDPIGDAAERVTQAAGAESGPVFKKKPLTDADALELEREGRRAGFGTHADSLNSTEYAMQRTELLGLDLDKLSAALRIDGETGPITLDQLNAALTIAKAELPESLHSQVVAGQAGFPPVLAPTFGEGGRLSISEAQLRDPAVVTAVLANPLNYLPPEATSRHAGESDDRYATRMSVTMVEAGLLGTDGSMADMIKSLGMDASSDGFHEQAAELLRQWSTNALPPQVIQDSVRLIDPGQLDSIRAMTQVQQDLTAPMRADSTQGRFEQVAAYSTAANEKHQATDEGLARSIESLSAAVLDRKESGKVMASLLQDADRGKDVIGRLLGSQLEAAVLAGQARGDSAPDIDALTKAIRTSFEQHTQAIVRMEADIRTGGVDTNPADLVRLAEMTRDAMASCATMQQSSFREMAASVEANNAALLAAQNAQLHDFGAPPARPGPPL